MKNILALAVIIGITLAAVVAVVYLGVGHAAIMTPSLALGE